jgi:hypothetical protein
MTKAEKEDLDERFKDIYNSITRHDAQLGAMDNRIRLANSNRRDGYMVLRSDIDAMKSEMRHKEHSVRLAEDRKVRRRDKFCANMIYIAAGIAVGLGIAALLSSVTGGVQ